MATLNPRSWSQLPLDIFESIFKRLSFTDFHRAKFVCSNWTSSSKLVVPPKIKSPWLMLSPEGAKYNDGCVQLYNPEEDRIYKTKRDISGIRFFGNWGNWFLAIDSRFSLYIIDVFSEKIINLPPLESLQPSENCKSTIFITLIASGLNGFLWVDEKTQEYIVVWFFESDHRLWFCKKGDDHYTDIQVFTSPEYIYDVQVLRGQSLYILSSRDNIRFIDLSRPQCFRNVSRGSGSDMPSLRGQGADSCIIVINTSGEALLVHSLLEWTTVKRWHRTFRVFKKSSDRYEDYIDVDSLGNESLLLGSRIFVSDIEPNSIYITSHDRICHMHKPFKADICVFNLVTKTLKRFPRLTKMKLKDSRWFLPRI